MTDPAKTAVNFYKDDKLQAIGYFDGIDLTQLEECKRLMSADSFTVTINPSTPANIPTGHVQLELPLCYTSSDTTTSTDNSLML